MNISRNFFSEKKKAAASIQENTVTREKQKEKKSQQKVPRSHRNAKFLYVLIRIVFLKAELPINLTKVLQLSIFLNKLLILMFRLKYLYTCSKNQPLFATKLEEVFHQCLENESYHWHRLHHDISKTNIAFT